MLEAGRQEANEAVDTGRTPGTELGEETRFPGHLLRITVKHAKIMKDITTSEIEREQRQDVRVALTGDHDPWYQVSYTLPRVETACGYGGEALQK